MTDRLVPVSDLVTIDEIAKRLHWSVNSTVNVVTGRDSRYRVKFPRPVCGTSKRGVWLWPDVEAWCETVTPKAIETRKKAAHSEPQTRKRSRPWAA